MRDLRSSIVFLFLEFYWPKHRSTKRHDSTYINMKDRHSTNSTNPMEWASRIMREVDVKVSVLKKVA